MDLKAKQDACQELGIPLELYEELLADYSRDGSERIEQLKKALDASSTSDTAQIAHALKGSSLNLRVQSIAEPAKQLELAAKSGADLTTLNTLFQALQSRWAAFRE